MKRTETMWAIAGTWCGGREFLYSGASRLRKDAIQQFERDIGRPWADLKRQGNRAVKVTVTWQANS